MKSHSNIGHLSKHNYSSGEESIRRLQLTDSLVHPTGPPRLHSTKTTSANHTDKLSNSSPFITFSKRHSTPQPPPIRGILKTSESYKSFDGLLSKYDSQNDPKAVKFLLHDKLSSDLQTSSHHSQTAKHPKSSKHRKSSYKLHFEAGAFRGRVVRPGTASSTASGTDTSAPYVGRQKRHKRLKTDLQFLPVERNRHSTRNPKTETPVNSTVFGGIHTPAVETLRYSSSPRISKTTLISDRSSVTSTYIPSTLAEYFHGFDNKNKEYEAVKRLLKHKDDKLPSTTITTGGINTTGVPEKKKNKSQQFSCSPQSEHRNSATADIIAIVPTSSYAAPAFGSLAHRQVPEEHATDLPIAATNKFWPAIGTTPTRYSPLRPTSTPCEDSSENKDSSKRKKSKKKHKSKNNTKLLYLELERNSSVSIETGDDSYRSIEAGGGCGLSCCCCCRDKSSTKDKFLLDQQQGKKMPVSPGPVSLCLYSILTALLFVSFGLFFYEEYTQVTLRSRLYSLNDYYLPVSCEPNPRFNNKLIHIDCPLKNLETFFPPTEFSWNVAPFKGVFFETRVEMYQWTIRTHGFGIHIGGVWSDATIDISILPSLVRKAHINPNFFPHVPGSGRHFASNVYAGGFRLSPTHLRHFHGKVQLEVTQDGYYSPSDVSPPSVIDYANTQVHDNCLWSGNPLNPKVGDIKITFWGSKASHASALAMQKEEARFGPPDYSLKPFAVPSQGNHTLQLVREGDYSPQQMIAAELNDLDPLNFLTWGIRLFTFAITFFFAFFTYKLCGSSRKEGPFVCLGTLCLAGGLLAISAGVLWTLCSYFIGAALLAFGLLSLVLSILLWSSTAANSSNGLYSSNGLLDTTARGMTEMSPQMYDPYRPSAGGGLLSPPQGVGDNKGRHFYHPV